MRASGYVLASIFITFYPIKDSPWANGLRQAEDAIIRRGIAPYIDEEQFFGSAPTVLIPCVNHVRSRGRCQNGTLCCS
jgi:hypothetical protein